MMVAAIDCGTNTIKLLIGDLPAISVVESRMSDSAKASTGRVGWLTRRWRGRSPPSTSTPP